LKLILVKPASLVNYDFRKETFAYILKVDKTRGRGIGEKNRR